MMSLIGTHLVCKLTIMLYVTGLKREVPHVGEFKCQVILHEKNSTPNVPDYVYVDCTKDIAWIKTNHRKMFWYPLAGPNEGTGMNCHE